MVPADKEEPPSKRSGKPQGEGGLMGVRAFWPHWIWGLWLGRAVPLILLLFVQTVDIPNICEKANQILAVSLYIFIWPPFEDTHTVQIAENLLMPPHICILFIVEVFQRLFLFGLSRILKRSWKQSAFRSKKTPSYHTVTPTLSKECNGCVPKGDKSREFARQNTD